MDDGSARWQEAHAAGADAEARFFDALDPREPADVEAALRALAAVDPADHYTTLLAAIWFGRRRDPADLPRLRSERARRPAQVAEMSGTRELDLTIAILEAAARGVGCNCQVYAWFNTGVGRKDLTSRTTGYDDATSTATLAVTCAGCGREWTVEQGEGYRGPSFSWRG